MTFRLLTPFVFRCQCGHCVSSRTGAEALQAMNEHLWAMASSPRPESHAALGQPVADIVAAGIQ